MSAIDVNWPVKGPEEDARLNQAGTNLAVSAGINPAKGVPVRPVRTPPQGVPVTKDQLKAAINGSGFDPLGAITAPFKAASSVAQALAWLTDPHNWLRLGMIMGGAGLMGVGLVVITLDLVRATPGVNTTARAALGAIPNPGIKALASMAIINRDPKPIVEDIQYRRKVKPDVDAHEAEMSRRRTDRKSTMRGPRHTTINRNHQKLPDVGADWDGVQTWD